MASTSVSAYLYSSIEWINYVTFLKLK